MRPRAWKRPEPARVTHPARNGELLFSRAQHFRAALHCLHDVDVARATAEITFQTMNDLVLGRLGIVLEQASGRHDHAGSTKTTLQPVALRVRLLDGVQLAVLRQALDRQYVGAIRLCGEDRA